MTKGNGSNESATTERGQMVLVAAIFVAIALIPIVFAYLQLGYNDDVEVSSEHAEPVANAKQLLEHAIHKTGTNVSTRNEWNRRNNTVTNVRDRLQPHITALERSQIEKGTVYHVTYNDSAAAAWAVTHCPSGPARQFGPCKNNRGVVVQNRVGETHVLVVALDVRITTEQSRIETTVLIKSEW